MKAPLHFKNFIKNLFKYENSELFINAWYIEKVNIHNSYKMRDEPILCYISCVTVEALKVEYDRDIANNDYFNIIFEEPSNKNLVANLNIIASFELGHNRYYTIPIERLKEYIIEKNIIKKPVVKIKIEEKIIDNKIDSRFGIMEIE
jgi:hypothetical protein